MLEEEPGLLGDLKMTRLATNFDLSAVLKYENQCLILALKLRARMFSWSKVHRFSSVECPVLSPAR
jgi:hypothetical protein